MTSAAKILIVDDDSRVRKTLEETLLKDGYLVTSAANGNSALKLIAAQTFDLVLLDLKLGDMEGLQVMSVLRRQQPHSVVILLTAHASLESAIEALRLGAHDYLFKPWQMVKLRESIRSGLLSRQNKLQQQNVLRQLESHLANSLQNLRTAMGDQAPGLPAVETLYPQNQRRFLQYGQVIVDFTGHIITIDKQLIEFSPTEFGLMAYLVSEAPRVVSPTELVKEVQGYESESWEASEVVRQHVYRLRQKIKDATALTDVIQTVRGIGYTIKA